MNDPIFVGKKGEMVQYVEVGLYECDREKEKRR